MYTFNLSISVLVLFTFICKIDAECTGLVSISPFLEKFLPTLVTDDPACGSENGKKMFTDCMMILFEGDAKLCDTTQFHSSEYPNCSAAIKKESLIKLSTDGKIQKFWRINDNMFPVSVHKLDDNLDFDQMCPKVSSYLLHRDEAFGGKTKNPSAWKKYCDKKENLCKDLDKLDSVEFFKNHAKSISFNLLLETNQSQRNPLDTVAMEIASTLYNVDPTSDTEYLSLRYCLYDLFKIIEKKLN